MKPQETPEDGFEAPDPSMYGGDQGYCGGARPIVPPRPYQPAGTPGYYPQQAPQQYMPPTAPGGVPQSFAPQAAPVQNAYAPDAQQSFTPPAQPQPQPTGNRQTEKDDLGVPAFLRRASRKDN